eukprot:CAMPEP_0115693370 /NCGR_PEP_ID=MMETSP0272-20121206/63686_1 /TAXON_ID=71861 /ORGANISM="Scrippsiella trochoidea, Strain CCMP3099" /LENGTH=71 /DNA_ID=CAMNT_0003133477 /DNA_START=681 /DNA_END=892 /DNA_ORIENTATION=+
MARLLDEAADLRELVQASARTALDLSGPSTLCHRRALSRFATAASLLQALLQEREEVVRLPTRDVGTDNAG